MILILMGVSGAGKSTIGQHLAKELGWPLYEGDDFHSRANIQKMASGLPLTDADRAAWLAALARLIHDLNRGKQPAVITCSALKGAYRQRLRKGARDVRFVYLQGSYALIQERLQARHGHYMRPALLKSQFEILEEPKPTESLVIDTAQPPETIVHKIMKALSLQGSTQA
jgi:gluconokinase